MIDGLVMVETVSQEEGDGVAERQSAAGGDDGKEEPKKENSKEEAAEAKKVSRSPARLLLASLPPSVM